MSLDLRQVMPQVEQLGQEAARRGAETAARLPRAEHMLAEAARLDPEELRRRIDGAPPTVQPARPTDEPIDGSTALPDHPPKMRVLAADGSQVYPDRHGAAFFYLVNVGSIALAHGSGTAPQVYTHSRLHFTDDDLQDTRGQPVDTHLINARRDAAELEELARLAAEQHDSPTLALLDNGLLLWAASQEQKASRPDVQRVLEAYLQALGQLKESGVALAGYISRPRSAHVVGLAEVGAAEPSALHGVTDRLLFGRRLSPHQRSARYRHPAKINEAFAERGHEVHFFYLHTGAQDGIARVEVPAWVAEDRERMAAVHAGLVEQCRLTGIPYPLVRAHELALVGHDDRRALENLVQAALVRHGNPGLLSQKAQTKRWTGRRRRHRI